MLHTVAMDFMGFMAGYGLFHFARELARVAGCKQRDRRIAELEEINERYRALHRRLTEDTE